MLTVDACLLSHRSLLAVLPPLHSQALPNLPLPAVVTDSVVVHHADMRCWASSAAAAAAAGKPTDGSSSSSSTGDAVGSPSAVWSQLEQLVAGGDMPSTNWLEGAKQVGRLSWCMPLSLGALAG